MCRRIINPKLSGFLIFTILISFILPSAAMGLFPEKIEASAEAYDSKIVLHWIDPDTDDLDKIKIVGAGKTLYIDKGIQTAEFTGLVNGVPYTFRLYAVSRSGILYSETEISAIPVDTKPPMPVTNALAKVYDDHIVLSWTDPVDSDLDRIRISVLGNDYYVDAGVQKLTIYDIEGFKEYELNIVAIDTSGNESEKVIVYTLPGSEAKITLSGPGTIKPEEVFSVGLNLSTVCSDVYAVKASVFYDSDKFIFTGYEETAENIIFAAVNESVYGKIDICIATATPVTGFNSPLIDLIFIADKTDKTHTGIILVDNASIGLAPSGEEIEADGDVCYITVSVPEDQTPPGEVTLLSVEAGDKTVKLRWKDPEDEDLKYIVITVNDTAVYKVSKGTEEFILSDLTNGAEIKIVIQTVDFSDNVSSGITVYAVPVIPGDMNNDGIINIGDLSVVMAHYGTGNGDPDWEKAQKYDVSGENGEPDGVIDIFDLIYIAAIILGR